MRGVFVLLHWPRGRSAAAPHLWEGQAVLVGLFVFELKVIESFALRWGLLQRLNDLDEVGGEKAVDSAHLAVVPVLVHLSAQDDDVALAEFEVSWFLAIVVVECFGTRELGYPLETEGEGKMGKADKLLGIVTLCSYFWFILILDRAVHTHWRRVHVQVKL